MQLYYFYILCPGFSIQVRNSRSTPIPGEEYTLNCSVIGVENINPNASITYLWIKHNGTAETQVGTNSNTLSFTPFRLSDAGRYTCQLTVSQSFFVINGNDTGDVLFQSE